jgi:colicin import membrane protein
MCSITFPQAAKVDVDRGQAVLDSGMLSVTLPIIECIDNETGQKVRFNKYGDIVAEKSASKKETQKSKTAPAAPAKAEEKQKTKKEAAKPSKKQKEAASPFEDQMEVSENVEESSDVSDASLEVSAPTSPAGKKMKPKKIPVSAMTSEQLEEKRQRQKKKAPAEMDFTLKTIEELAAVEEKKRDAYLQKETQKVKHFEEKETLKIERKEAKKERAKIAAQKALTERKKKLKADREAKKAMAEDESEEAPSPKPEKKRKVSFSEGAPKTKKTKTK